MRKYQWMMAAILFCGTMTMMTSCSEDDDVVTGNGSQIPSVVDNGEWTVKESYVDNSIRPGDDFYMHRIGSWWNETTIVDTPTDAVIEGYFTDVTNLVEMISPASPSVRIFGDHLDNLDANTAATEAYLGKVWGECGYVDAIAEAIENNDTKPIWKSLGKMMAHGAATPFEFDFLSVGGKIALALGVRNTAFPHKGVSGLRKYFKNADFCRAFRPLVGDGGTRSVNGEQWPQLVIMLQEAGIDPSWVYVPSDILDLPHAKTMDEEAQQKLRDITKGIRELCEAPVDTLVKRVNEVSTSEWEPLSSEAQYQAYKKSYEEEYKKNMSKDDFIFFYKSHFLQYEISRLTGQKFVTDEMRQVGMEMCNTVISVFADRIKANTWLSEEGKKGVLEKLYAININVGCPKEWISEAIPDLSQSGSAVEDAYLMRKAALNFDKYVMGKSIKDVSFHMILSPDTENPLTEMNAFYAPNHNSINIYPWWLMKPCYDPSYNQAVNYAIMTVIGHEITHGFDSNGYQFNKDGDPVSIFTNAADEENFIELGKKLVARFNELEVLPKEMPGVMSKGEFCLGENIADLGGFEIGLEAYNRYLKAQGFSGDELVKQQKRLFYAYTEQNRAKYGPNYVNMVHNGVPESNIKPDEHSLNRERVNGIVRNVDSWYELFDIKVGDALYLAPADRVHIW